MTHRHDSSHIVTYAFLAVVILLICLPLYWAIITSIKPAAEVVQMTFLPSRIDLTSYDMLFATNFLRWVWNSIVITAMSVMLGLLISSLAGYAFAKYRFPFREVLFWMILASVSLPELTTIVPLFSWFVRVGLINTYTALVLPYAANAFAVFLVRQYAQSLPDELIEAARLDGLHDYGIFFRIVLPIMKPALATASIFMALRAWNEYLLPLIMLRTSAMYTFPVGLSSLMRPEEVNYGLLMAATVLSTIPMTVFFLLVQKHYVAGLTRGSIR